MKVFIAGTAYYYYYNVAEDSPAGNVTNIYTLFYPVLVNDKLEGPLHGNITNSNGDTLIDATSGTLNADALSGNVDSTLIAGALFNVAADDSTQRAIAQGNTVQIIGAGGITTTSDADGVITDYIKRIRINSWFNPINRCCSRRFNCISRQRKWHTKRRNTYRCSTCLRW